ncbi:hypothetical protein PoB_003589500 [Plakobranchus ocellatus]|uniref:Uncharacterized protein n=1 Tax=Plakobranchus ocellatus TaxID=259542 RepID=A0AAV4AR85_9GAST|nr:hypothetical protein PoB_003589500 [Plakobranchus ocellatus]
MVSVAQFSRPVGAALLSEVGRRNHVSRNEWLARRRLATFVAVLGDHILAPKDFVQGFEGPSYGADSCHFSVFGQDVRNNFFFFPNRRHALVAD